MTAPLFLYAEWSRPFPTKNEILSYLRVFFIGHSYTEILIFIQYHFRNMNIQNAERIINDSAIFFKNISILYICLKSQKQKSS